MDVPDNVAEMAPRLRWELIRTVGEGAFGEVHEARCAVTGARVSQRTGPKKKSRSMRENPHHSKISILCAKGCILAHLPLHSTWKPAAARGRR